MKKHLIIGITILALALITGCREGSKPSSKTVAQTLSINTESLDEPKGMRPDELKRLIAEILKDQSGKEDFLKLPEGPKVRFHFLASRSKPLWDALFQDPSPSADTEVLTAFAEISLQILQTAESSTSLSYDERLMGVTALGSPFVRCKKFLQERQELPVALSEHLASANSVMRRMAQNGLDMKPAKDFDSNILELKTSLGAFRNEVSSR